MPRNDYSRRAEKVCPNAVNLAGFMEAPQERQIDPAHYCSITELIR